MMAIPTSLSLRWRLALWVALVVVTSSGITFFAVYRGTGTQLRRQIDSEIEGDAGELAHALSASGARTAHGTLAFARGYVRGQPFNASSTVLFVLVPGAGTATNTPELFGNPAPDDGESVAVQAQENRLSRRLLAAHGGFSTLDLPDVGYLRLLERQVRIPGAGGRAGLAVTVGVGEPLASVARAQHGVARAFILAGFLALAGALLASLADRQPLLTAAAADGRGRRAGGCRRPPSTLASTTSSARAGRCRCWRTPSTTCSTASLTRLPASASSSPTPRTSCARR